MRQRLCAAVVAATPTSDYRRRDASMCAPAASTARQLPRPTSGPGAPSTFGWTRFGGWVPEEGLPTRPSIGVREGLIETPRSARRVPETNAHLAQRVRLAHTPCCSRLVTRGWLRRMWVQGFGQPARLQWDALKRRPTLGGQAQRPQQLPQAELTWSARTFLPNEPRLGAMRRPYLRSWRRVAMSRKRPTGTRCTPSNAPESRSDSICSQAIF